MQRSRPGNPCDGCSLRRVRCRGGPPCTECEQRSINCTFLRVPGKRGPKGPRLATVNRVQNFQDYLQAAARSRDSSKDNNRRPDVQGAPACAGTPAPAVPLLYAPVKPHEPRPLHLYVKYLSIFQDRLQRVWPVISCEDLIARLVSRSQPDNESYALAAATCAAGIAQLRLPEHRASGLASKPVPHLLSASASPEDTAASDDFFRDVQYFRDQYDFREQQSIPSLLTSFFLHIYFANTNKLRTAAIYLRESIAQLHLLGFQWLPLRNSETSPEQRELQLRIFWILFISERTFCVQNGLPATMIPIPEWPSAGQDVAGCGEIDSSFQCFTQLFTLLDDSLIEPQPSSLPIIRDDGDSARNVTSMIHSSLLLTTGPGIADLNETQRVNIVVTRSWTRILWWEYALRHFAMSCRAEDPAFSIVLPASIAREMLGFFSSVSKESVCAHGYGMELKVFRIADSLLDVLACRAPDASPNNMLFGSRDALYALEQTLAVVGGRDSQFVRKLRSRMATIHLPLPDARSLSHLLAFDGGQSQDSAPEGPTEGGDTVEFREGLSRYSPE